MPESSELAQRLLLGPLNISESSALDDPELFEEVSVRLRGVGQRAVRTTGGWIALPIRPLAPENADPHIAVGQLERVLLAWLYLHLVFLPAEGGDSPTAAAAVIAVEELERWARERGLRTSDVEPALGRLARGSFVRRQDRMLRPGPALLAVHDPELQERCAAQLMRERLRRMGHGEVAGDAQAG